MWLSVPTMMCHQFEEPQEQLSVGEKTALLGQHSQAPTRDVKPVKEFVGMTATRPMFALAVLYDCEAIFAVRIHERPWNNPTVTATGMMRT